MRKLSMPTPPKAKSIRLFSPQGSPEPKTPAVSPTSDLPPLPSQSSPVVIQRTAPLPKDDTLEMLLNPQRVKPKPPEGGLPRAMESPILQQRQDLLLHPPGAEEPLEDDGEEEYYYEDDPQGQPTSTQGPFPFAHPLINPEEEELKQDLQKAKLLARIEQLKKRGIKPDKDYGWQTALKELRIAVAKMETIAMRSVRIEQGRAALMFTVGGVEKGCNYSDENKLTGDFKFYMNGYSKHLYSELPIFDDCLEQGVEELLGPLNDQKWYVQLSFLLGSSMVKYSMTNRESQEDQLKRTITAIKQDKDFIDSIKRELMEEMRAKEVPAAAVVPTPVITMKAPALNRQPNKHPGGDIDPNPADTNEMILEFNNKQTTSV